MYMYDHMLTEQNVPGPIVPCQNVPWTESISPPPLKCTSALSALSAHALLFILLIANHTRADVVPPLFFFSLLVSAVKNTVYFYFSPPKCSSPT